MLNRGPSCVQLLQFEMSYSRADHEAWLRGPGRDEMAAARKELGVDGFEDEADFEEEVAIQMQLFDRCACMWRRPALHCHRCCAVSCPRMRLSSPVGAYTASPPVHSFLSCRLV